MGSLLEPTIKSVLSNLRGGDEYFVVDGGSNDCSIEVLQRYEGSLSGWVSEPDNGYAEAIAKGFARATGTFMCWINSGDVLLDGAIDRAREILEQSGADLIFGDDLYIDEAGQVISYSSGYVKSLHNAMLYGGWTPLQDACFWRRSAYERICGINRNIRYAADYEFFLRFSATHQCRYVPIAFSAFRRHASQKSISGAEKYHEERETYRQRELSRSDASTFRRVFLSIYYWVFIRYRAKVLCWYWDRPSLHGRLVYTLSARV